MESYLIKYRVYGSNFYYIQQASTEEKAKGLFMTKARAFYEENKIHEHYGFNVAKVELLEIRIA